MRRRNDTAVYNGANETIYDFKTFSKDEAYSSKLK
jgi:hypothetical protein